MRSSGIILQKDSDSTVPTTGARNTDSLRDSKRSSKRGKASGGLSGLDSYDSSEAVGSTSGNA
jgi:hypothetical protein